MQSNIFQRIISLFVITVFLGFMACKDNIELPEENILTDDEVRSLLGTTRTLQEATDEALNAIEFFSEKSGNLKTANKQIKEVKIVGNTSDGLLKSTGSEKIDTTVYIFNFADSAGYAIVSADTRIGGIIGYSDYGIINDSIDDEGLYILLSQMTEFIKIEQERYDKLKPQAEKRLEEGAVFPEKTALKNYSIVNQWGPLCSSAALATHKFNTYLPTFQYPYPWGGMSNNTCESSPEVIAMANICLYHKYPSVINGFTVNWNDIKAYLSGSNANGLEHLRMLIKKLSDLVGTTWPEGYVTPNVENYTTLRNVYKNSLSFQHTSDYVTYSTSEVKRNIRSERPVFVNAYSTKSGNKYSGRRGWLVDGYADVRDGFTGSGTIPCVHVRWGIGGSYDGWYHSGFFDLYNAGSLTNPGLKSSLLYQYEIKMLHSISYNTLKY